MKQEYYLGIEEVVRKYTIKLDMVNQYQIEMMKLEKKWQNEFFNGVVGALRYMVVIGLVISLVVFCPQNVIEDLDPYGIARGIWSFFLIGQGQRQNVLF